MLITPATESSATKKKTKAHKILDFIVVIYFGTNSQNSN